MSASSGLVAAKTVVLAAGVACERPAADAGVVDQDVERSAGFEVAGGEGVDRGRVEEVQLTDLDTLESGQCGGGAVGVA